MPISENEYREPKFIKYRDRYPLTYDKKARFTDTVVSPMVYVGRSNGNDGYGWKRPGYNPNHNSTTTEKVSLTNDNASYKPY